MVNEDAIRLSAKARQLRQEAAGRGSRTVYPGDPTDEQAIADRRTEWQGLRAALDATLDAFMAYPVPDVDLFIVAERIADVLECAGSTLDTMDRQQSALSDVPVDVSVLGSSGESPTEELIGINDHLPRVPEEGNSYAAGRIRMLQESEAWHYPIHLRRWHPGNNRPTDCPQCFGNSERCPLGTADQRLCPHRH